MPIFRKDEPGFWYHGPKWLDRVHEMSDQTGAHFSMFSMTGDVEEDRHAPMVALFYLPPGMELPAHAHDCHRVEVVVQGSLVLPDGTVLRPGDVSTSSPGEFYGPHVAGPEGSLTAEIFSDISSLDPVWADFDPIAALQAEARTASGPEGGGDA